MWISDPSPHQCRIKYNCLYKTISGTAKRFIFIRLDYTAGRITSAVHTQCCIITLYKKHRCTGEYISLYIISPGGSVTAGMAIYDTMNYIKCDVSTICIGMAASMGAFLLSSGAKGKRIALPNAEVMIHQPSAGTQGKVTDMEIDVEHFLKIKQRMNKILSENTGKTPEQVKLDSERDNWMTAEEARDYGLVDKVIYKR